MKKFEKIFYAIAIAGFIMKLLNIHLSSMIIFLSLLIVSGMYLCLGFAFFNNIPLKGAFKSDTYKGIKSIQVIGSAGLGWGLSMLLIGIMFEILKYPMSRIFLIFGIIISLIFIILLLILYYRRKNTAIKTQLIRGIVLVSISIIFLALPAYSIEKVQYRNHPEIMDILIELDQDPSNEALKELFMEEKYKIELASKPVE
ncbi:MAG: hypothetical protein QNK33_11610 [Bacteroidales bacterium]|nr:hypothetical protein [Bacteroidales bacterium]